MTKVASLLAVVLLPLFWPIGVVLLWLSPVWSRGAKLMGTLIVPGGLALAAFLQIGDRSSCPIGGATGCVLGPTYAWLHPGQPSFNHVFGALVFSAAVVLPLAVVVYLASRLRRRWAEI